MPGNMDNILKLIGRPKSLLAGKRSAFPEKGYLLLAYLTLDIDKSITRQKAAALLWSEMDAVKSMASLRQLVVRMNKHAGSKYQFVEKQNDQLYLTTFAQRSDLSQLLNLMDSTPTNELVSSLKNVSGILLETVDPETEDYSVWLDYNRTNLQKRMVRCFEKAFFELSRFGIAKKQEILSLADHLFALDSENKASYQIVYDTFQRCHLGVEADQVAENAFKRLHVELTKPRVTRAEVKQELVMVRPRNSDNPVVVFAPPKMIMPDDQNALLYRAFVEDVSNRLARFRTFTVLATHSAFNLFENPNTKQINVDYRVESFVSPDNLKMPFRLIEEKSGKIVWSAEYDVSDNALCHSFGLIGTHVATALADGIESNRIFGLQGTAVSEAYLKNLQGTMLLKNSTLQMLRRARKEFRKAVILDPNWAAPRARVAQTLQMEWLVLGGTDTSLLNQACFEAENAIVVDPFESSGHWVRAVIAMYQRDIDACHHEFAEAESLSPNSADLLVQYADALCHFGNPKAAKERFDAAIKLNPSPPDAYLWVGAGIAFNNEDYHEAVRVCDEMEDIEPALRLMTACLQLSGDTVRSRYYAGMLKEIFPGVSAREIVKLIPDSNPIIVDRLVKALTDAGL